MKIKIITLLFIIGVAVCAEEIKPIHYSFYGGKYQGTDGYYTLGVNSEGQTYIDIEVPQMSKYYKLLNGEIVSIEQYLHGDEVANDFGYSSLTGELQEDGFYCELNKTNGTFKSRLIPIRDTWMPFDVLIYHFQQQLFSGTLQNEFELGCFVEKITAILKFNGSTFYASPADLNDLYLQGELAPTAAWNHLMSMSGNYFVVELAIGGGLNGFYPYKNWFVFDPNNNWDSIAFFGGKPGEDMVLVFKD